MRNIKVKWQPVQDGAGSGILFFNMIIEFGEKMITLSESEAGALIYQINEKLEQHFPERGVPPFPPFKK